MSIRCRSVRRDLALFVGGDLEARRAHQVRRHLADCAACRVLWQQLGRSHDALTVVREDSSRPHHDPLWPDLRRQIARPPKRRSLLIEWMPVGLLAAACLVVYALGAGLGPPHLDDVTASAESAPAVSAPRERGAAGSAARKQLATPSVVRSAQGNAAFLLEGARPVGMDGLPREF